MRIILKGALVALVMAGASIGATSPVSAANVRISIDPGVVAFGYSDGYWDHDHNWHRWRDAREARMFREQNRERYWHRRHDRERNAGWRDDDGDGVPNRFDSRPNNPYRD